MNPDEAKTRTPKSTGFFVPNGDDFIELPDLIGVQTSYDEVAHHLGYTAEQLDIHVANPSKSGGIKGVLLELFTERIILVHTDDQLKGVTPKQVASFLQTFRAPSSTHQVEYQFREGIAKRSLPAAFFERVFSLPTIEPGAIVSVPEIGYILFFNEGYLDHFQPSDGLNAESKQVSQLASDLVARREKEAHLFWGNQPGKIAWEVNRQMEAYMQVPMQRNNPFIPLHRTPYGTVNYAMLLVCHYEQPITLAEFQQINHGRYKTVANANGELRIFTVGQFRYEFLSGTLSQVTQLA